MPTIKHLISINVNKNEQFKIFAVHHYFDRRHSRLNETALENARADRKYELYL